MPHPDPTFGERFEFVRFLLHLRTGKCPENAEIGRAVGRTGQWVTKWAGKDTAPPDYLGGQPLHAPLLAYFGVGNWLIDGAGDPPDLILWQRWRVARQDRRTVQPAKLRTIAKAKAKRSDQAEHRSVKKHAPRG